MLNLDLVVIEKLGLKPRPLGRLELIVDILCSRPTKIDLQTNPNTTNESKVSIQILPN
jgi:hypothetical protein